MFQNALRSSSYETLAGSKVTSTASAWPVRPEHTCSYVGLSRVPPEYPETASMTPGISLKRCSTPQKQPPAKVAFSILSPLYAPRARPAYIPAKKYCAQNRRSVTNRRLTMNAHSKPPPKRQWLQMVTVDITPLR